MTFGLAGSSYYHDEHCERRALALLLGKTFGLKVGALSLLCQDPNVRRALYDAASYCPHTGSIGLEAKAKWDAENKNVTNDVDQYRKYKESLSSEKSID